MHGLVLVLGTRNRVRQMSDAVSLFPCPHSIRLYTKGYKTVQSTRIHCPATQTVPQDPPRLHRIRFKNNPARALLLNVSACPPIQGSPDTRRIPASNRRKISPQSAPATSSCPHDAPRQTLQKGRLKPWIHPVPLGLMKVFRATDRPRPPTNRPRPSDTSASEPKRPASDRK